MTRKTLNGEHLPIQNRTFSARGYVGMAIARKDNRLGKKTYCIYCGKHHNLDSKLAQDHAQYGFPKSIYKKRLKS